MIKKLLFACIIGLSLQVKAQNFEISTIRIGDFKIFMDKQDAEKIAKKHYEKMLTMKHLKK